MRVPRNQNGSTLLGVLMLSALLGVVAVEVISFFEKLQVETANIRFHGEAAALTRSIKNILAQENLCSQAMRNDNSNPKIPSSLVVWDPGTSSARFPVAAGAKTAIVARVYGGSGQLVARIGQIFGPAIVPDPKGANTSSANGMFQITDMYLRRSYMDLDGASRADGQASINNGGTTTTYNTVTAKLVLQFQYCGLNGALCQLDGDQVLNQARVPTNRKFNVNSGTTTIDVTVAINPTTKKVESCYEPSQKKFLGIMCGPTNLNPAASTDCKPLVAAGCQHIYFMQGLDGQGTPICSCHQVCHSYFKGPKGTATFNTAAGASDLLKQQIFSPLTNQSPNTWDSGGGGGYYGFNYMAFGRTLPVQVVNGQSDVGAKGN